MTRELDENWKRRERTSEEDALERVCVYVEKEHWLCLRFYCLCSNILLLFYCCISARKTNKHAVVGVGVGFWLCCWSMPFWNGWASYEQRYKEGAAACSSSSASNNSSTASRSGIRFLLLLFFYLFSHDDLDVARPQQCAILINFCRIDDKLPQQEPLPSPPPPPPPSSPMLLLLVSLFFLLPFFCWCERVFFRSEAQFFFVNKLPTIHKSRAAIRTLCLPNWFFCGPVLFFWCFSDQFTW